MQKYSKSIGLKSDCENSMHKTSSPHNTERPKATKSIPSIFNIKKKVDKNIAETSVNRSGNQLTSEEESDSDNQLQTKKSEKKKREYEYVAIEENIKLEDQIENIKKLGALTEKQINYMVLRDVNYFLDIYSGEYDHSWRHAEYKKNSKKSGNLLYSNAVGLGSYTQTQISAAVEALQLIFCRNNHKLDGYIVKVALPEALIKICMRIYQCSKDAAELYLKENNLDKKKKTNPNN